jgi:hypothetical protein
MNTTPKDNTPDELETKLNFWLSQLQVRTVQQHPPIKITDVDQENLEKAVAGLKGQLRDYIAREIDAVIKGEDPEGPINV